MCAVTESAYRAMTDYILSTESQSDALRDARKDAEEFGIDVVDVCTGSFLSLLGAQAARGGEPSVIAVTPAAGVTGLYLFEGMGDVGHLTCIDPELEHQKLARSAFRAAGIAPSRYRFLPSLPLEVMDRLAYNSYDIVCADVAQQDFQALIDAAWPLLAPKGMIVLTSSLLDGTVADQSRTDRETAAARSVDEALRDRDDALVTRFPLAGGLTVVTKR